MFGFDSTAIRPQAAENLRNLAGSLKEYPDTDLLIVGHTDASGTDAYNLDLSSRRARAAADYLSVQGVPMSRLRVVGRGEAEPRATNDTDAGQQLNRRIEIAIFASAKQRTTSR
jgi:outer membrane protein OmpA-like peptidoglycan-associated protein